MQAFFAGFLRFSQIFSRAPFQIRPQTAHGHAKRITREHFCSQRQTGKWRAPAETEKEHLKQIDLPGGAADSLDEIIQAAGKHFVLKKLEGENGDGDIIKAGVHIGIEPIGGERPVETVKFEGGDIREAGEGEKANEPEPHAAAIEIEIKAKGGDEKIANEQQAIEIARNIDGTDEPFIGHIDNERSEKRLRWITAQEQIKQRRKKQKLPVDAEKIAAVAATVQASADKCGENLAHAVAAAGERCPEKFKYEHEDIRWQDGAEMLFHLRWRVEIGQAYKAVARGAHGEIIAGDEHEKRHPHLDDVDKQQKIFLVVRKKCVVVTRTMANALR